MTDVYYYEQRSRTRGPGKPSWTPRLHYDWPPIEDKTMPPIRGVKKLNAEDHEGWSLADYQAAYGEQNND